MWIEVGQSECGFSRRTALVETRAPFLFTFVNRCAKLASCMVAQVRKAASPKRLQLFRKYLDWLRRKKVLVVPIDNAFSAFIVVGIDIKTLQIHDFHSSPKTHESAHRDARKLRAEYRRWLTRTIADGPQAYSPW